MQTFNIEITGNGSKGDLFTLLKQLSQAVETGLLETVISEEKKLQWEYGNITAIISDLAGS